MKLKLFIGLVLVAVVLPFFVVLLSEHLVATKSADESRRAQEAYIIIVSKLDKYVAETGKCPESLGNLAISDLPVNVNEFEYSSSNGVCIIVFHGRYVWFEHSLNYGKPSMLKPK
ncbi:MAG TPA: hypothetical protein VJT54_17680 [Verrucomicrobiae bacterium]|nr:hypothetical protein [Verrucomicrobiae bacterium]